VFKYKQGFKYKPFVCDPDPDYFEDEDGGGDEDNQSLAVDENVAFGDAGARTSKGLDTPKSDVDNAGDINEDEKIGSKVLVKAWNRHTPYLKVLSIAKSDEWRGIYWRMRPKYKSRPAFFLECSDFFHSKGDDDFAVRILSNIEEFNLADPVVERFLACEYAEMGRLDLAIEILENAVRIFPENPEIHRELALLIVGRVETQKREKDETADYAKAIELLWSLVIAEWSDIDMALLAVMDINRILPKAKNAGLKDVGIPLPLIRAMDADLRIVITDFSGSHSFICWIEEPSEEKISRAHPLSLTGGIISGGNNAFKDYFTRNAMKGAYRIKSRYADSRIERLFGAMFLKLDIFMNYGRPKERHNSAIINLRKNAVETEIGQVKIK
jgi:tetratricopeptide (TPR) repeat protein